MDMANQGLLVPNPDQDVVYSAHTPEDLFAQLASPLNSCTAYPSLRESAPKGADKPSARLPTGCVSGAVKQVTNPSTKGGRAPLKVQLPSASLCHLSANAGDAHRETGSDFYSENCSCSSSLGTNAATTCSA